MIHFMKVARLDYNKMWERAQNEKRKYLFGTNKPTENYDDINYQKKLIGYMAITRKWILQQQKVESEIASATFKEINLEIQLYDDSRNFYIREGSNVRKQLLMIKKLKRNGMMKLRKQLLSLEE